MDNLEAAQEEMDLVAEMLDDDTEPAKIDVCIKIANFYVLYDIAKSLRLLSDLALREDYK